MMKRRLVAWILVVALLVTSVIVDVPGRIFAGESTETASEDEIMTEDETASEQMQAEQETAAQGDTAGENTENESVSEQAAVEADTASQATEIGVEDKSTESNTASEDTQEDEKAPQPKKKKAAAYKAESAEEVEEDLSMETYSADLPVVGSSYKVEVEIDGVWQPVTSDMELYVGQNVRLSFEWQLSNNDRDTVQFTVDRSVFALTGLNITDSKQHDLFFNAELVGTYQVVGDQVVIDLTKEEFVKQMDTRKGGIELEGKVSNLADKTQDGEKQNIKFGSFEATPVIFASPNASSVNVWKTTAGGVTKNGDKYQQKFEIHVTANDGKVTNVDLTDTYNANQLSNPSGVTVVTPAGTASYPSLDAALDAVKALTLYAGDTVTVQYTMDVNADIYKSDSPNYTNTVNGEYISNRSDDPKKINDSTATVGVNKPTVSKSFGGADTAAGTTTWTITVDMRDCYEPGKDSLSDYLTSVTDIPGTGLMGGEQNITLDKFTSNGNGQWTYTYTMDVTDAVKDSVVDETVKNTAKITTKQGDTYTGEHTGTYPGQSPAKITKAYIDNEKRDDGVYVTWEITLDELPEGIKTVTVTDKPTNWDAGAGDNSMQQITGEVWVNGTKVVENSQIAANNIIESWATASVWDSGTLIFKDDWIEANRTNPIRIRFVTLITQDITNRKFINSAELSYEDKTTGSRQTVGPATAAFRDISNLVSKTGEQQDATKNVLTYTLRAAIAPLELENGKEFKLVDTLPEGLELVPGTKAVSLWNAWNPISSYYPNKNIIENHTSEGNVVTFTITVNGDLQDLVKEAAGASGNGIVYLQVAYDARVKDEAAFIKAQKAETYENKVEGTYDGTDIGTATAKNTLTPADVVNKVSEYAQATAPYVHYKVTVNPNAVALLGDAGGELTATDEIGDALRFVTKGDFDNENNKARYGVKIYTTNESGNRIDLLANGAASYTRSLDRHTLTFKLPDSTAITIEYYAYAKPKSQLTPENTTNKFSLEGTGNTAKNHAVANAMTAYVPSGWASAETGSITLVKYWTDGHEQVALNGSVFKLVKAFVNDDGAIVEGEVVNESLRVTDKNDPDNAGAIRITGLLKNQLYALYEVEADSGMALNREPFYFVIADSTLVSLPKNVKTFDVSGEIYLYENVEAGGLKITKTIQGNVTREEAEGALKFKVTWTENGNQQPKNVLVGEYTLKDFDYDVKNETWTLTLDDLAPGKYTVEETVYDIDGKPATSVVYSKNNGTTWSSPDADAMDTKAEELKVDVWNKDKTNAATVEYKNIYDTEAAIYLSKKIVGGSKRLEGAALVLSDEDGNQVAWTSSSAEDKKFAIGEAPGEIQLSTDTEKHVYTLTETAAPEGYSVASPVDFIVVKDANDNVMIQLYDKDAGTELGDADNMIENITLTLYDKKLDLNILKVNNAKTGAAELAGAEFALKQGDEVLATVTTTAGKTALDASKLKADGATVYTLTETKAPDGCKALTEDITFTVAADGKINLVTPAAGNRVSLETDGITFRVVNEELISISGKKIWDDSNDSDDSRPVSVTVALEQRKAGGTDGDWTKVTGKEAVIKGTGATAADLLYTFDDLPKYDEDGNAYEYRVVEDTVPNYECSGGTAQDNYNITNTYVAERINVAVTKVWADNNNQDGLRTDIYVQLYKNGVPLERYLFKLNENDWTHTWTGLLKKENGVDVTYTVKETDASGNEVAPTGYIATVSDHTVPGSDTITYKVTNTHEPEKTSLTVKKKWVGDNDVHPESVTVRLYADNADTKKTQMLNAANNWQAEFTDLDAYRDKGTAIKYSVVETTPAGYTVSYAPKEYAYAENAKTGTITVTNTYKPGETGYTVKKVWADGNNRDGKRPDSINVQLCADGTPIENMTQYVADAESSLSASQALNEGNNWTYTWDGLKEKENPTADTNIEYSVVELTPGDAAGGGGATINNGATVDLDSDGTNDYTVTYNHGKTAGVTTITNSYTPETVSLEVEKKWLDSDGTDYTGTLPAGVTVRLYSQTENDENPVVVTGTDGPEDAELNTENSWKASWTNLPKYADGKLITYTVKELSVPDGWTDTYATEISDAADASGTDEVKITVTNTKAGEQLAVRKIWDDDDNAYGRRPDHVKVQLLKKDDASGTYAAYPSDNTPVELNEGNGWRYTWRNLPDGDYTVEEQETAALLKLNYNTNAGGVPQVSDVRPENGVATIRVTNKYTVETTAIDVQKLWNDNNNQDGIRPAEVVVNLYKNNRATGKTLTLNAENDWKGTFTDLPVYDTETGGKNVYRIIEASIANYTAAYSPLTGGLPVYVADKEARGSFTVTNSYTPGKRSWTVTKVWKDGENRDGIRPTVLRVRLYADGEPIDEERELSEENNWTYTWENLDAKEDGEDISYTVHESEVPAGYTPAFLDDNTTGFTTLTNTYEPQVRNISVQKQWDDGDNQDGNRPAQITVQLKADGADYGVPVILSADSGWAYTWTDLPVNAAGREIAYTVVEAAVPDYSASYGDLTDGVITITNSYTPGKKTIAVNKVWQDMDNADGIRPAGIQVQLYADGAPLGEAVTLSAENAWNHTWSELAARANGREIAYTVQEIAVPEGYEASVQTDIGGNVTLTNTHKSDVSEASTEQTTTEEDTEDTEDETEEETDTEDDTEDSMQKTEDDDGPKTGDAAAPAAAGAMMMLALAAIAFLYTEKKKH